MKKAFALPCYIWQAKTTSLFLSDYNKRGHFGISGCAIVHGTLPGNPWDDFYENRLSSCILDKGPTTATWPRGLFFLVHFEFNYTSGHLKFIKANNI